MATYKLIQDIEAEDHILGPLTFRQFVFALIAAFLIYLCFISVVKQIWFLLVILVPPTAFCIFFAFPWGGDQPTETWALAKLHFLFKPRRRVWSQSGIKELVTITVPKKVERVYTDGLSQTEVKSRLQALANTLDSRGWAVKHVNAVGYTTPQGVAAGSDRLLGITEAPEEVPNYTPAEDILDTDNNPVAQQFGSMIDESARERRERLMAQMQTPLSAAPAADDSSDQWFMNHTPSPGAGIPATVPSTTAATAQANEEAALSLELKGRQRPDTTAYGNMRTLQPAPAAVTDDSSAPMTASGDPAILSLSTNDDLNVATIAREASKRSGNDQEEVVISLH